MSEPLPALSRPEAWFLFHVNELPEDGWDDASEQTDGDHTTIVVPVSGPAGSTTLSFTLGPDARPFGTAGAPSRLITPSQFRLHGDRLEIKVRRDLHEIATADLADYAEYAELAADCLREYSNFYSDSHEKQSELNRRELALRRRCVSHLVELERRNTTQRWPTKVLPCRSVPEAHLAMDWLNWPAVRDHRVIDIDGQLAAEYTVTMDGEPHTLRFAFPSDSLNEELDGGTGRPSSLIRPGMFWHMADRLTRIPDAKTEPMMMSLLCAARCFNEVLRSIPAGQQALNPGVDGPLERAFRRLQPGALTRNGAEARAAESIARLQRLMS